MNANAKLTGLAHIGIFTADLDKSVEFYKSLGFTVDADSCPGPKLVFMSLGTCLIELICPPDASALARNLPLPSFFSAFPLRLGSFYLIFY